MPKFLVTNRSGRPLKLGVEPWAALEIIAPDERVIFEYVEPAEIEFVINTDGRATIGIVSDDIKIIGNGRERAFRMPPGDYS